MGKRILRQYFTFAHLENFREDLNSVRQAAPIRAGYARRELEHLFHSLMQRAFHGELVGNHHE